MKWLFEDAFNTFDIVMLSLAIGLVLEGKWVIGFSLIIVSAIISRLMEKRYEKS